MDAYFASLRQGQVLDLEGIAGLEGRYVVVSQSCDVVQPKRELVQVAPLVELVDAVVRRGALNKENPRFPLVGGGDPSLFADLARIVSVLKSDVEGAPRLSSLDIASPRDARDFGLAVGRWFGRFAFPDEVQPWLAPVQKLIREKYDNPSSPLGRVLQDVVELRVEADDWDAIPVDLTLHVIVTAGVVPTVPEDIVLDRNSALPTDLTKLCDGILSESDSIRRSLLWAAFADQLATKCTPRGQHASNPIVRSAVSSVVGELSSDDDFPLARIRRSEALDVDFLSDPTPY